jgi:hypothetical protein
VGFRGDGGLPSGDESTPAADPQAVQPIPHPIRGHRHWKDDPLLDHPRIDLNPLRDLLGRLIDFERLRKTSPFKLFIGATRASSGKLCVFREHELSIDVLLASACLPKLHHPVLIDGEAYWDGGYSANPAVFPLCCDCDASDVLLVLLDPLVREGTPRTVEEIDQRITELAFGAHVMRKMRMVARATAFARPGLLPGGRLERRLQQMRAFTWSMPTTWPACSARGQSCWPTARSWSGCACRGVLSGRRAPSTRPRPGRASSARACRGCWRHGA